MTQYKAIPQPGDNRNQSQLDILNNFNYLNSQTASPNNGIIRVDHFATGDNGANPTDGFHKQISFSNVVTAPSTLVNAVNSQSSNSIIYPAADGQGQNQVYFFTQDTGPVNRSINLSAIRAVGFFSGSSGALDPSIANVNFNAIIGHVAGSGAYNLTFINPLPNAHYLIFVQLEYASTGNTVVTQYTNTRATTGFSLYTNALTGSKDPAFFSVMVLGLY